jgi:hypothetical protein
MWAMFVLLVKPIKRKMERKGRVLLNTGKVEVGDHYNFVVT